jgi:hypothetical protein
MRKSSSLMTKKFILHSTVSVVCVLALLSGSTADAKLKAKEYEKNYSVSSGEVLEGAGQGKTIIEGRVKMKNGSTLRNLTVEDGGIEIASGATATIENVTIKDAKGDAAIITTGGGTLTVRNSQIKGSQKGMYIQRGKNIVLIGNIITGNREEAVDIRSDVSGVISGNIITGNGESGIEVILGSSSLKVVNNTITGNGSSGIAAQFYTLNSAIGGLTVSGNKLSNNKNFGIDCRIPSGGKPDASYWYRSIFLDRTNTVTGNNKGNFAPRCGNLFRQVIAQEARQRLAELTEQKDDILQQRAERQESYREEIARMIDDSDVQISVAFDALQSVRNDLDAQNTWQQQFKLGYYHAVQDAQMQYDNAAQLINNVDIEVTRIEAEDMQEQEAEDVELQKLYDDGVKKDEDTEVARVMNDELQQRIDDLRGTVEDMENQLRNIETVRAEHEWLIIQWWTQLVY